MIQNNIRRAEELKKITSSVIKLRAELDNVSQAQQKLMNKLPSALFITQIKNWKD